MYTKENFFFFKSANEDRIALLTKKSFKVTLYFNNLTGLGFEK